MCFIEMIYRRDVQHLLRQGMDPGAQKWASEGSMSWKLVIHCWRAVSERLQVLVKKNKGKYHINIKNNKGLISNLQNKTQGDKVQVLVQLFLHRIFSNWMTNDCQLICEHVCCFRCSLFSLFSELSSTLKGKKCYISFFNSLDSYCFH